MVAGSRLTGPSAAVNEDETVVAPGQARHNGGMIDRSAVVQVGAVADSRQGPAVSRLAEHRQGRFRRRPDSTEPSGPRYER